MFLGIIADDFTGGTDIAGFVVQSGLSVTQYIGVPTAPLADDTKPDAAVISLKSRSCAVEEAVRESLQALEWLKAQGCKQFYFKYCSTFDSTAQGNIGPVTDALLEALGASSTVLVPALPVNGRTVYQGYLFVFDQLLHESGMKNHPVTPMSDAHLGRLMEAQGTGKAGNILFNDVQQGAQHISAKLQALQEQGIRYIIPDTLTEAHLKDFGKAFASMPLVTGGSGLAMGLAQHIAAQKGLGAAQPTAANTPQGGKCIILSGSASVMTNAQVAHYKALAPSFAVDVHNCVQDAAGYAAKACAWVMEQKHDGLAPMVYATTGPDALSEIQKTFGVAESSHAVESFFAILASLLKENSFDHFIVAGGETSGAVVQALGVQSFGIGEQIAPGVPWVKASEAPIFLALKSGNFGTEAFFNVAQGFFAC